MAIKAAPFGVMSINLSESDPSGETVFYMRPATARDDVFRSELLKTRAYAADEMYGLVTKIEANMVRVRTTELWTLYDHAECVILRGEEEIQPFKPKAEMNYESFLDAYYMLNSYARTELWSKTMDACAPGWKSPF